MPQKYYQAYSVPRWPSVVAQPFESLFRSITISALRILIFSAVQLSYESCLFKGEGWSFCILWNWCWGYQFAPCQLHYFLLPCLFAPIQLLKHSQHFLRLFQCLRVSFTLNCRLSVQSFFVPHKCLFCPSLPDHDASDIVCCIQSAWILHSKYHPHLLQFLVTRFIFWINFEVLEWWLVIQLYGFH